ncbi:MAG: radical SAM protein [Candidatus Omnitrophica bacterium]|jgi:coproporphyrinogen III oxidase-like Fe-S oxidoreductase|nr:radical SAM protein [Candidatus Omnitrophota bacterium]MDD3987571.1 radical SAM protein [Candidatus Omnitrophota bacterium]MDD4981696.1 radical SAM protein [Candidatus Omnitrophota bacterium]MDD5664813.1 radical SAM protein [Candidatus Omnitrophota bacterium]
MSKNINKIIQQDLARFKLLLKQSDNFYDINQLHALTRYSLSFSYPQVRKYWKQYIDMGLRNNKALANVDLYVHIPFCRSKCSYCIFPSMPLKGKAQVEGYIDYLIEEMHFYSKTFKDIEFRNIYIGGGTPSVLSSAQMNRLLKNMFGCFAFRKNGQRTSECNPHSVSKPIFSVLRDYGFNRISFGVQSLNAKALKVNKRDYQDYEVVRQRISEAKQCGFNDINVDLIAGLGGDTLEGFKNSFTKVARLKPYNIVVYGLMPPRDSYLADNFRMSKYDYFTYHYSPMIKKALKIMAVICRKYGYIPDSLDPSKFHWGFRDKGHLEEDPGSGYTGEYGGCTLGLGNFSRSHIHGVVEYRNIKYSKCFSLKNRLFEGREITLRDEMAKYIINCLDRESRISLSIFNEIFGENLIKAFPYAIYALRQLRLIHYSKDNLIFRFRNPQDKYVYSLFFLK